MAAIQHVRDAADFVRLFDVSRETVGRLAVYAALLAKWQKTINLVAPSTVGDVWHRHFADSAQVVGVVWARLSVAAESNRGSQLVGSGSPRLPNPPPQGGRESPSSLATAPPPNPFPAKGGAGELHWLDLGSGGGFPGLVVAILLAERDGWRVTLVESDQRKCAFLREVVRETGLKAAMAVDIVAERIESAANHSKVGVVDVVSARALAALPQLLRWAGPFFGPQTVGVFLKGRDAGRDVEAARGLGGWAFELVESVTDAEARVVRVRRAAG